MKEQPNYYAILSAEVRYDNRLKANVKLLFAEITALCNMNAECFASNKYFADLYGKSKTSISVWISELVKFGYIKVHYTYKVGTKEILNRYISILKGGIQENLNTPYKKTSKSNTTSINTMKVNTKGGFLKPTRFDIKGYCIERKNNVDCETFYDFYESKDWLIGKNKMKDWKACVRTWEKRNKINKNNTNDRTTAHRFDEDEDYGDGVL